MGDQMMVKLPEVDRQWPEDLHPWETIEVRGWGPVNQWEWERLAWWQSQGITEMDADVVLDLQREAAAEGIGMYNERHAVPAPSTEDVETVERADLMIRIAKWAGVGAIGVSILIALLMIVMNQGSSDDVPPAAESAATEPAPSVAAEAETPAVTDSIVGDDVAVAASESTDVVDLVEPSADDDPAPQSDDPVAGDAEAAAGDAETAAGDAGEFDGGEADADDITGDGDAGSAATELAAGPYSGTFLGPVSASQPDGVVGPGSTVDLDVDPEGQVTGRVELGILWSSEGFVCTPPPDELWGEVGPIDVSSGSGQAPVVLNRFFPACSGITTGDPVTLEAVFHVTVEGTALVGGIEFSGVLGLPWEASPDF